MTAGAPAGEDPAIGTSDRPEPAALREQLLAFLAEVTSRGEGEFADETPLITSGMVESTALLHLALWVEQWVDPGVDISAFELSSEWDTVGSILSFVERHRPARPVERRPAG